MYLSRRGSLAKSGAGDQATRIDVRLKGVAEIVSSALGGSIVGKVKGCVCVLHTCGKGQGDKFVQVRDTKGVYFCQGHAYMYMYTYRSLLL